MNDIIRGAVVDPSGRFRYRLWRYWGGGDKLVFVMLNPSTADAGQDDPTVRKCMGFARRWGYDGIEIVNLFAFRATNPDDLRVAGYPVGELCDYHLDAVCRQAPMVICAWGGNARGLGRAREVWERLADLGVAQRLALRVNTDGTPAHPLMLPYGCQLQVFTMPS